MLQVLLVAAGFVVPVMFFLGAVFAGLWFLALYLGRRVERLQADRGPDPDEPGSSLADRERANPGPGQARRRPPRPGRRGAGRFERKGLPIVAMDLRTHRRRDSPTGTTPSTSSKRFYPPLREFITSGPLVALVLEGDQAIAVVRGLIGATDGRVAAAGHDPRRPVAVEP